MDMRFGMSNIRNLYRAGSLTTVERVIHIKVRFSGSAGGQMGWQLFHTTRRIHIFLRKGG
jgi:hypothetical protein